MSVPASTPASLTSFTHMFGKNISGHVIREIEIPLIQRDYAQGRMTEHVNRIRARFIDTLCKALLPNSVSVDLDFVFGDVVEKGSEIRGRFYPLDGQQRLTTLFLLHCYLAWRTCTPPQNQPWRSFSYATRPEARAFCEFLIKIQPDCSSDPSLWIRDHADYLSTWQHDPTVQSMLVVLDALHKWFSMKNPDVQKAWEKLVNKENPAIRFHVLPLKENGLTDELYIKMNSRGKSLTPFENFKAHFEDLLKKVHPEHAQYFSKNIDTVWSDILWTYCGSDHLIDDEFMRYFHFITDVCAWKDGSEFEDSAYLDVLTDTVYGRDSANADAHIKFMFAAFDIWKSRDIRAEFQRIFTKQRGDTSCPPLLIFDAFEKEGVDLFHACCKHYGTSSWTLSYTLIFYGVLLGLIHQVVDDDFFKRLRVLRNLIIASNDEIRVPNMPKLLIEAEQIVLHGDLRQVNTFNQVQVSNELAKADLLETHASLAIDLYRLEDHDLLRGGLTAFDLDPVRFQQRAQTFIKLFDKTVYLNNAPWKMLSGALLAKGDYSRCRDRNNGYRAADFGAPKNDDPWRTLFRGRKGEQPHRASVPLMALLDTVSLGFDAVVSSTMLRKVMDDYLSDEKTQKDWRFYFVKYDVMRAGSIGHYKISTSGYQVCMMHNSSVMRSYYYDPYLLAAVKQSQIDPIRIANPRWPCCFSGYETERRALVLKRSELQIQCIGQGWQLSSPPTDQSQRRAFDHVCATFDIGADLLLSVPQHAGVDKEDRIIIGGRLIADLIENGL